jgi:Barstar (barnase inhibitor)
MTDWVDLRARLPWLRSQRVHVIAADRVPGVRTTLEAAGFRCMTLDGSGVVDLRGFFAAAARGCGFAPHFGANWDAFRDALGDLDASVPGRRLALIWTEADTLPP